LLRDDDDMILVMECGVDTDGDVILLSEAHIRRGDLAHMAASAREALDVAG
jgi:hypothetical protein